MCGRYRIKDPDVFREYVRQVYGIELPAFKPRYNVAPSQILPVIATGDPMPRAAEMKWGLVPFWEKSDKPRLAPINARAPEAFSKPMFRQSIQRRRCLVPADGFYEWQVQGSAKQPMDISLKDGRPFFFAGIYEEGTANRPESYLLITTEPNSLIAAIHNRMPVILTGDKAKEWLQPGEISADKFAGFTAPYPAEEMTARPISTLVNSPRNDVPECITGPDDPPQKDELFP